jgi:alcohol dehydrogenase
VIISCISACGHCDYCKQGVFAHCLGEEGAAGIGWILGHLIDGTEAEFVRVPYAETSVYKMPDGVTPQAGTLLSDILPTGHEIGVQYGAVKPGDVVAVVGAGPVGLAAITFAMVLDLVRPAGHVANVGVHSKGADLPLDKLWISNITITTGLVNTNTTGTLLKLVAQQKLQVDPFVSHEFDLNDIEKAYDTFSRAAETKALKVMLNASTTTEARQEAAT